MESKESPNMSDVLNELRYFRLLYSDEILDDLVEESNNYYRKLMIEKFGDDYRNIILSKRLSGSCPYLFISRGITREDILAFIGVRIYMGILKLPLISLYWKGGSIFKNVLHTVMTRNYYLLLSQALHFPEKDKEERKPKEKDDNTSDSSSTIESCTKIDPRHKVKLYLDKLAINFQKHYVLGRNITIDESLLHFKGRNSMKYYIPMKPYKWGFKIHLLCDSDTSYLYNMVFDPGRVGKDFIHLDDASSLTESIVLRLLSPVHDNVQRNIFFDGWYSSISLMKKLTKMGYLNTTILRNNSKEVPSKILKQGYDRAYNEEILVQKYEGKKTILFATNYEVDKEELRNNYNIKNRGVDTFDHYLSLSSIQRRSKKWYKKIILFGVEAAIINSKIICELRTGKRYTTVDYKEKIVEHIFKMYEEYNKQKNFVVNSKVGRHPRNKTDNNNSSSNSTTSSINSNNNSNSNSKITINKNVPDKFKYHNIGIGKTVIKCQKCQEGTKYICTECNINLILFLLKILIFNFENIKIFFFANIILSL